MKTTAVLLAFLTLAQVSGAQQADSKRVDAIWDAASSRMSQQADSWFDDGEFPTVINFLIYENNLYPNDYDVASDLGWMQENVEQWDAALATYRRYDKLNPQDPDHALMAGQYFFMRKRYAEVPPLLEPAVKNDKVHPNNFRLLAHAYEHLGKWEEAKRVWDRLIALSPADLPAKANLKRVEARIAKGAK